MEKLLSVKEIVDIASLNNFLEINHFDCNSEINETGLPTDSYILSVLVYHVLRGYILESFIGKFTSLDNKTKNIVDEVIALDSNVCNIATKLEILKYELLQKDLKTYNDVLEYIKNLISFVKPDGIVGLYLTIAVYEIMNNDDSSLIGQLFRRVSEEMQSYKQDDGKGRGC